MSDEINKISAVLKNHLLKDLALPEDVEYSIFLSNNDAGHIDPTTPNEILHEVSGDTLSLLVWSGLSALEKAEISELLNILTGKRSVSESTLSEQLTLILQLIEEGEEINSSQLNLLENFSEIFGKVLSRLTHSTNNFGSYEFALGQLYTTILHELQHIYDYWLVSKNGFTPFREQLIDLLDVEEFGRLYQYLIGVFKISSHEISFHLTELTLAYYLSKIQDSSIQEQIVQLFYLNGWMEIRTHLQDSRIDISYKEYPVAFIRFYIYNQQSYSIGIARLPDYKFIEQNFTKLYAEGGFQACWQFTEQYLTIPMYEKFRSEFLARLPRLQAELIEAGVFNQ